MPAARHPFFELAYETAALAQARGLKNILVTRGYPSEATLRKIAGVHGKTTCCWRCGGRAGNRGGGARSPAARP